MIHLIEPPPAPRQRKGAPKGRRLWGANTRMTEFFKNHPTLMLTVDEATKEFGISRPSTASRLSNLVKQGVLVRVNAYRLKDAPEPEKFEDDGLKICPDCFVVFKP